VRVKNWPVDGGNLETGGQDGSPRPLYEESCARRRRELADHFLSFSWSAAIERDFAYTPDGNGQFDPNVSLPSLTHPTASISNAIHHHIKTPRGGFCCSSRTMENGLPVTLARLALKNRSRGALEEGQHARHRSSKPTLKLKNPQHHPRNGN